MNIFHKRQEQVDVDFCYFYADTIHQYHFKKYLLQTNQLHLYKSDKSDRACQFWKRDPLAIAISTEKIFISKLEYIHNNPVKWALCIYPEEYKWSSARFYMKGKDEFNMLTHYKE